MSFSKMSNSQNRQEGVEYRTKSDGSTNPKYIDLLDEDKAIAGQKFACISFVSPENIIKQREMFYMEEFIKGWDFSKSVEKFNQFLNFVSYKYNLSSTDLTDDLQSVIKEEGEAFRKTVLLDEFKNFMDRREDDLEKIFNETHNFQTSVRGLKVRGSFPTQEEAELRCKLLRELDPNHDVYVGPVGLWIPFHPEAYKTGRVEYLEDELNQLMMEKKKNEEKAKDEFEKRVKETKQKAIEENIRKAGESGNKLTQTINNDGNLVGVNNINTQENALFSGNETVTSADIRRELFEGDNVVTSTKTDHGLSSLSNMKFSLD